VSRPIRSGAVEPSGKRLPVMYWDVALSGGRKGRVGVCRDDDPGTLAANFARTYQLKREVEHQLRQLIAERLAGLPPASQGEPSRGRA
jgi:hypothetical protein